MLKVLTMRIWQLKICSTVLYQGLKPAYSSDSSSASDFSRLRMKWISILLGWLMQANTGPNLDG